MTSPTVDVVLREVTEEDLPIFFEHQRDPEANRMAAFAARDRDAFMAHWTKLLGDPSLETRAVVADGQVAGNIGNWEQSSLRLIGYWIGREFWGRGVATQALSAFLDEVTTRPLYAHVATTNVASIRVLEKCGFTRSAEDTASLEEPEDGVAEVVMKLEA